jgi:murein DD-endopeptidase MepM/ murein hydrolase activator NlpD
MFFLDDRAHAVVRNREALLQKFISKYSSQKIVCLDIDEEYSFELKNGTRKKIKLVSVKEHRDSVIEKMRLAEVNVKIDDKAVDLICAPYVMPTEVDGLRIQADTTAGWVRMPGKVQLSVWDATEPIVKTDRLAFPIPDYLLFSHGIQNFNEVVHLGRKDGNPNGPSFYHNYGIDFAGYEGGELVLSPVDGVVRHLWSEEYHYCSITLEDENGMIWAMSHLDSKMPYIAEGLHVEKGQAIGFLGMQCSPGRFSHLHIGTYFRSEDGGVHHKGRNVRLNLYPWFVTAYKELADSQRLLAVARPHHSVRVGEEERFDGSNSLAFDSKIVAYKWQFHDGRVIEKAVVERKFDKPGTFIASLFVTDDKGNEDVDFCKVKVYPSSGELEGLPSIFMSYTPTVNIRAGEPVKYRIWLQGADKNIPIKVDFGDGDVINDYKSFTNIQHEFKTTGIHIVTAEAMVNDLPITQKQKVIVKEK